MRLEIYGDGEGDGELEGVMQVKVVVLNEQLRRFIDLKRDILILIAVDEGGNIIRQEQLIRIGEDKIIRLCGKVEPEFNFEIYGDGRIEIMKDEDVS